MHSLRHRDGIGDAGVISRLFSPATPNNRGGHRNALYIRWQREYFKKTYLFLCGEGLGFYVAFNSSGSAAA